VSTPIVIVSSNAVSLLSSACPRARVVDSLREITGVLDEVRESSTASTHTLDLTGHTRRGTRLLRIGRDTLDLLVPSVEKVVEDLAASAAFRALRITALRLMGCESAVSAVAQQTIKRLGRLLGIPVYGTLKSIGNAHHNADGFDPVFDHLLIEASQLPNTPRRLPRMR